MTTRPRILLVGLGSAHGDDQIGWLIVNAVSESLRDNPDVMVRKAALPLDILDWLDGIGILHVCDASRDDSPPGTIHRLEVTDCGSLDSAILPEIRRLRCGGSHDYGLGPVLDLAARLGRLPQRIVVHAVTGREFHTQDCLSDGLTDVLPKITQSILNELNDARNVSGAIAADAG
ncbi:MAG: hydrogenase maturation protease [Planctomycetaceae bacterium]